MFPFVFKLSKGIKLMEASGKYFLISQTPIRYLVLNEYLYRVLLKISNGVSLNAITEEKTDGEQKKIVEMVFNLVSKGFLELDHNYTFNFNDYKVPLVSIIIPVRNRPDDIADCLKSVNCLCYPKDKIEVIVVDDGSTDNTVEVIQSFGVKLVCNDMCKGPGECRNIGEKSASGEILVFLDSDCTVCPNWLTDIVPFLTLPGIGAVGGFVAGYFKSTAIDRYEDAFSSLNMGKRVLFENNDKSMFYVPTCNLFVRRDVFQEINGFQPQMHVGEDVDFCWRLRKAGYHLLYLPKGKVFHKHRNLFWKMLKRRFEYGTSEADLYSRHEEKKKSFPMPLYPGISFIAVLLSILAWSIIPLGFLPVFFVIDFIKKKKAIKPFVIFYTNRDIVLSVLRSTFSFWYYACFYLIRYYLILMVLLGCIFPTIGVLFMLTLLVASTVDYFLKRPKLFFLSYLLIYILEHAFYQCGVYSGCFNQRYYRCLMINIKVS